MRSAECGMHTEFSQEATERTEEDLQGLHGLHRYMGCQAQTPWWIQQKAIPMNRIGMSLTPRTQAERGFSCRFVFSICSNLISVFTMYWVTKRVTDVTRWRGILNQPINRVLLLAKWAVLLFFY